MVSSISSSVSTPSFFYCVFDALLDVKLQISEVLTGVPCTKDGVTLLHKYTRQGTRQGPASKLPSKRQKGGSRVQGPIPGYDIWIPIPTPILYTRSCLAEPTNPEEFLQCVICSAVIHSPYIDDIKETETCQAKLFFTCSKRFEPSDPPPTDQATGFRGSLEGHRHRHRHRAKFSSVNLLLAPDPVQQLLSTIAGPGQTDAT